MLEWIRSRFGPVIITIIIGFITFVFIFFGIYSPSSTQGLHEGSVAGKVNGDIISLGEFNRELNRRVEFYRSIMGGQLNETQIRSFRIRETVFQDLVNRKLMSQEAKRLGLMASDEEVRLRIQEIPAFQKEGKFDATHYRQVLEANQLVASSFERMMREDLSVQKWSNYFKSRTQVSESEIKRYFQVQNDKRNLRFVQITPEAIQKNFKVSDSELEHFLKDEQKINLLKGQYEVRKETEFKGKTFEEVKKQLAKDNLTSEKTEESRKLMEVLADQVLKVLTSQKSSNAQVNALLKPYGLEVKETGFFSRADRSIPYVGEAQDLHRDAFNNQLNQAKKYTSALWRVVAVVSAKEEPNFSKFESQKDELRRKILSQKERELFDDWMKTLTNKATIDRNPDIVGDVTQASS